MIWVFWLTGATKVSSQYRNKDNKMKTKLYYQIAEFFAGMDMDVNDLDTIGDTMAEYIADTFGEDEVQNFGEAYNSAIV